MFGPIAGFKGNKRQRDFVMFLSLSFVSWQLGLSQDQAMLPMYACWCRWCSDTWWAVLHHYWYDSREQQCISWVTAVL